jgi:DNA-directed RNA polymerase subunit RPC12/RpoP
VYLVRLGFRNKAGFHECPQCKSRSVWKADPYGTLEETLHRFLRLSPYRCARCDRRFMDSKIPASDTSPHLVQRWLSRASRLLHRTPLDEALKRYSIFEQPVPEPAGRSTSQRTDRSPSRSRSAGVEASGLGEKSGLRA